MKEGIAGWFAFMLWIVSGACFVRAFMYKLMKLFYGEEQLYSLPKYKKLIKDSAALNISPPLNFNLEQRKKWESSWWKFFIAFVVCFLLGSLSMFLINKWEKF